MEIVVSEAELGHAILGDPDEIIEFFVGAIRRYTGAAPSVDDVAALNSAQNTLFAYVILRDEVMTGGFVQLIHNGYGAFIFDNPFERMMKSWGVDGLAQLIKRARQSYRKYHEEIERDCSYDEFMAMFEQYPQFDDCDDCFVENEEEWTQLIALYVRDHTDEFVQTSSSDTNE